MDFISEKEPRGGGSLEARLCREITAIQEVVYGFNEKKWPKLYVERRG